SFRKSLSLIENLTLPRSFWSPAYAVEVASSSRPRRIVAVTPSPVHSCAFRSKSSGSSSVILRLADIAPIYQHRYHNTIWHAVMQGGEYPLRNVWTLFSRLHFY